MSPADRTSLDSGDHKELYDKGKGNGGRPQNLDDVYYNNGLAICVDCRRKAPLAIKKTVGRCAAEDQGRLESIKDDDANGFMAPVTVTAQDHGGGGTKTRIECGDG